MWHDPSFYILISFLLFVWFVGRPFYRKFVVQLKERSTTIERQINEAEALHQQARDLLEEQKKALQVSQADIKGLEKEAHDKIQRVRENHRDLLEKLRDQSTQDLKKEIKNLEEDMKSTIQKDLMARSFNNVQWILENALTDEQREKITAHSIEKVLPNKD